MGVTVNNNVSVLDPLGAQTDANPDTALNQAKKAGEFKSVLTAIGRTAGNILVPGLGSAIGGGLSAQVLGSMMPGLGSDVTQYLTMEQQMQRQQIAFETASNRTEDSGGFVDVCYPKHDAEIKR